MRSDFVNVLIAGGAIATAVFTGWLVVLATATHRHNQDLSGRRKPVVTSHADWIESLFHGFTRIQILQSDLPEKIQMRSGVIRLFNHSDASQTIDFQHGRVWWPRVRGKQPRAPRQVIKLDPHEGGAIVVVFVADAWPSGPLAGSHYSKTCWVTLSGVTMAGRKVKFRGRLQFGKYLSVHHTGKLPSKPDI